MISFCHEVGHSYSGPPSHFSNPLWATGLKFAHHRVSYTWLALQLPNVFSCHVTVLLSSWKRKGFKRKLKVQVKEIISFSPVINVMLCFCLLRPLLSTTFPLRFFWLRYFHFQLRTKREQNCVGRSHMPAGCRKPCGCDAWWVSQVCFCSFF